MPTLPKLDLLALGSFYFMLLLWESLERCSVVWLFMAIVTWCSKR